MEQTLLIVEDDEVSRNMMAMMCRRNLSHTRVLTAGDGREALTLARAEKPGVVVLDVVLPDLSGFDICRRLKSKPAFGDPRVLLISGLFKNPAQRGQGLSCGADGYLLKPFEPEELLLQLTSLFRWKARVPERGNGTAPAAVGNSVDLTAKAETPVMEPGDSNFRAFFETLDDLVMVAACDGKLLYSNQALMGKLGYDAEALSRMRVPDLYAADQRQEAEKILAALLRGERNYSLLPLVSARGVQLPAETRFWLGSWNGRDCLYGLCKDLSAEQEAQQRFERLFHNNPALMAVATLPDQIFVDVNESFLKALGYTRGEVIGKTVEELGLFVNPQEQVVQAQRLLREGRLSNIELQVYRKNRTVLYGLFSGERILSQGRNHFLTVMIDITERKRMEQALHTASRRLHEAQDEVQRKMARDLHDVTAQRLAAILMNLGTLADEVVPAHSPAGRLLAETQALAEQCSQEVRTFSYLLHPPLLDQLGLVSALRAYLDGFIRRSGIQVTLDLPPATERWPAEVELTLFRCVQEGLGNVHRHSGSRTAHLRLARTPDGYVLELSDRGRGLPAGVLDDLRNGPLVVSGVGLAGMQERLRLLGGRLTIESSTQGTRLCAIIPKKGSGI